MSARAGGGAEAARSRRMRRLAVAGAATGAGLLVYLAQLVLGQDVQTPELPGQASGDVSVVLVIVDGVVASLLAWALLALLERFTARAHLIWRIVASVVLLLSLSGPLSGTGVEARDRLWLCAMHLAVGLVLIVLLPGPARRPS